MEDGYTEYGYRGLAELKIKDQMVKNIKRKED